MCISVANVLIEMLMCVSAEPVFGIMWNVLETTEWSLKSVLGSYSENLLLLQMIIQDMMVWYIGISLVNDSATTHCSLLYDIICNDMQTVNVACKRTMCKNLHFPNQFLMIACYIIPFMFIFLSYTITVISDVLFQVSSNKRSI